MNEKSRSSFFLCIGKTLSNKQKVNEISHSRVSEKTHSWYNDFIRFCFKLLRISIVLVEACSPSTCTTLWPRLIWKFCLGKIQVMVKDLIWQCGSYCVWKIQKNLKHWVFTVVRHKFNDEIVRFNCLINNSIFLFSKTKQNKTKKKI